MKKRGRVADIFRQFMRCGDWIPYWELEQEARKHGLINPNLNSFVFDKKHVERSDRGFRLRVPECRHHACKARVVLDA